MITSSKIEPSYIRRIFIHKNIKIKDKYHMGRKLISMSEWRMISYDQDVQTPGNFFETLGTIEKYN